jgi:hypothetical protein
MTACGPRAGLASAPGPERDARQCHNSDAAIEAATSPTADTVQVPGLNAPPDRCADQSPAWLVRAPRRTVSPTALPALNRYAGPTSSPGIPLANSIADSKSSAVTIE